MEQYEKDKLKLTEDGHIPVWASKQIDRGATYDAQRYIEGKAKILAGDFGVDIANSLFYSPELMPDIWQMPKSEQEKRKWIRFFYNTDPYIYAVTQMHYLYPFSKFKATSSNEKVTSFYDKVANSRNFSLMDLILDMSLAYNKFGEAITMGQPTTDIVEGIEIFKWKNFVLFEPEVINIYKSALDVGDNRERYSLVITPEFKEEIRQMKQKGKDINPVLEQALTYNKSKLDLDNKYMSKIINKTDPSALRGTSPIQPLLRMLMFQDKVNLVKVTAIERFRYPLEIWKIGDIANNIIPDVNMLKSFENMIREAKSNPPYALFIPPYVNFDVAGYSSQKSMFDYKDDYEHVRDGILVGMGVSKDLILGENKGWGNTKQLTMHKLMMMYSTIRNKFENWMINNFYYPLAEENDFITETGDLNLPQIVWEKDLSVDRSTPDDMFKLWDKGLISTKTLFSAFKGVDYEQEAELIKGEIGSVYDDKKRIRNRDAKPMGKELEKLNKLKEEPKSPIDPATPTAEETGGGGDEGGGSTEEIPGPTELSEQPSETTTPAETPAPAPETPAGE
jgi:hypothetical protein